MNFEEKYRYNEYFIYCNFFLNYFERGKTKQIVQRTRLYDN